MRTLPVGQQLVRFNNFKSNDLKVTEVPISNEPIEKKKENSKKMPLLTTAIAVASLGVSVYALKGRKQANKALEASEKAKEALGKAKDEAKKAADDVIKELQTKIETLEKNSKDISGRVEKNSNEISAKADWHDNHLKALESKVDSVANKLEDNQRPTDKNLAYVDGMALMQNVDNQGKRLLLKENLREELQATAKKYMNGKTANGVAVALTTLTAASTVWLPTAESLPEKEGGLAEVPVQMAMNMDKMGINNYIVRPLMEVPGKSEFYEVDGKYYYYFKGLDDKNKQPRPMELKKVVSFDTNVFRNGRYESQPVEVFYAEDSVRGYKRLMFRNKDYFGASGLYNSSQMVSEAERYTFFDKIMYDFLKLKLDPKSVQGYSIGDKATFDSIKTPDAMVLNDWHTAPFAALARYKAPIEASKEEFSNNAAKKLQDLNLLYIVHNSDYQGDDWARNSEILNTLFDKYALDIYENAKTGFTEERVDENGDKHIEHIQSLRTALMINNTVNMANMGMSLAHKVKPVSRTYANDMATRPERARGLMHVTEYRLNQGTLEGASNGWDRSANEIAPDSDVFSTTKNMINKDISFIKDVIKNFPDFKYDIPAVREVKPITSDMDINELMDNAKHNKKMFVDYLKSCLNYNWVAGEYNSKVSGDKKVPLINFDQTGISDLSDVDMNKLDEIPVLTMGVRFTDQKGVDIVTKSLIDLYNNWEKDFPGKELPIVVIGGEDKEGPYRELAQNAKRVLGEKGKRLLYMDGFTPNPAFYAGSDYTLRPSHFEPDGDKWESLYRGTPMIMTRVGGHVDSIKDGFNGFLSARTVSDICNQKGIANIKGDDGYNQTYLSEMASDFKDAIKRGLDAYYDKEQYKQLVNNAIHGEQSWVQYDENGKIKECPLVGHMRDLGFDFKHESLAHLFSDKLK